MTEGIEAVWPEYESLASLEAGAGASSTLAPWVAREQVRSEEGVVVIIHPSFLQVVSYWQIRIFIHQFK